MSTETDIERHEAVIAIRKAKMNKASQIPLNRLVSLSAELAMAMELAMEHASEVLQGEGVALQRYESPRRSLRLCSEDVEASQPLQTR